MKKFYLLWAPVFFIACILLTSCSGDDGEIVLDGITIDGQGTKIKVEPITVNSGSGTAITLHSKLISLDPDIAIKDAGFVWAEDNTQPTTADHAIALGPFDEPGPLQASIDQLKPEMTYYVRVYIGAESGTGYGNVVAFTTPEQPADVIVINEGNYQSGDGSFATYNSLTEKSTLSVFASANGYPIGGTIQRAKIYQDQIYAVTNAADKLEVMDAGSFESITYLNSGFANPHAFAATGDKGYVTNWGIYNSETWMYENSFITILDLTSHQVVDSLMLDDQPQDVVAVKDYFYVSNVMSNTIMVIDASNDQVVKHIEVAQGPDRMAVDAEDNIWVICTSGNLVKVNTSDQAVEKTISGLQVSGFNEKMVINSSGDKLYYLSAGMWPDYESAVYELDIHATSAPDEPVITGNNFHGVGISPDNILYVADANAFQGNGSVIRYSLEGVKLSSFAAGRGPNGFIFR